jgi:5'-deoxynucleotidase YfbR-like HD superfamily hydrolase
MTFKEIDLSVFPPDRERGLKNLYRYSMFDVMYYRPNLWEHSHRLYWMVEELAPIAKKYLKKIDIEKARAMALVHDDAEMIMGDIQAGVKALMTKAQLAQVHKTERAAIKEISKKFPKTVHGYVYEKLLLEMAEKKTPEALLVTYVDKLDAHCESMHEVLGGNISLLRSVMFYVKTMAEIPTKYPRLKGFCADKTSPLTFVDNRTDTSGVKFSKYAELKPHTKESISVATDFPFYNEWRRIVLDRGGEDGLRWLTQMRESAPRR